MIPAGVRQMDRQDDFDDAEDRSGTMRASPTYLRVGTVLATVNDGLRPSLTAVPRGAGGGVEVKLALVSLFDYRRRD